MSKKTMIKTLLSINSKIIYTILLILVFTAIIAAPGIGIIETERMLSFYKSIDNLPPGSVVVIDNSLASGRMTDMIAAYPAWIQLWEKEDIKIMIIHFHADGPMVTNMLLDQMPQSIKAMKEYGKDWVFLGFVPGEETAQAAVVNDIRSVYTTDFYGTPIDELPMMKNIHNSEDFSIVLLMIVSLDYIESGVRQYGSSAGLPILLPSSVGNVPYLLPYYPRLIIEYVTELDAPSYEKRVKVPGTAIKLNDARSLSTIYLMFMLVLVNVSYFIERRREGVR